MSILLYLSGGIMRKIKGKRKGLEIWSVTINKKHTLTHTLYDTDIVTIGREGGYTNVILNSGGWRTNHTKNCMNDVLTIYNLKVIQKNFMWYLVDEHNTIAWDFEDGMNLGIKYNENGNMTIVRWGLTFDMRRA